MVFSSVSFLFLFLPLALIIHGLITLPLMAGATSRIWRTLANLFLLSASLAFYLWGEPRLIWVMVASTLVDYLCGLIISGALAQGRIERLDPHQPRSWHQKAGLVLSLTTNLGLLGYFKYADFGLSAAGDLLRSLGLEAGIGTLGLTLPLGISFYTFQSMSYTIDVYRGRVRATANPIDFACFVTLFPQLIAGPIVRYADLARELTGRRPSLAMASQGMGRFIIGLSKKVLLANTVGLAADRIFAIPHNELTMPLAWLGLVAYTVQVYFDFSGYSDMAIGLGQILGFTFPENFRYPYTCRSIQEFWRRWHISLSTWFRDYLYVPLGGNRLGPGRTYANLVTVFLLCGLWHGAAWTTVIWGVYHGVFLVLERLGLAAALARAPRALSHVYAMAVVMAGFVLFRADSLSHADALYRALVGLGGEGLPRHLVLALTPEVKLALALAIPLSLPVWPALMERLRARRTPAWEGAQALGLLLLLVLCSLSLASGTHNPFIYFRF